LEQKRPLAFIFVLRCP